jgi:hypothetical protein
VARGQDRRTSEVVRGGHDVRGRDRRDPPCGPDKGNVVSFGFAGRDVQFTVGDKIRVYRQQLPEGAQFFVALPTLLVFSLAGTPFGEAVNLETVAGEIVATHVGSIGLIAAVPVTTALAALLALRLRPSEVGDVHEHGYAH